MTDTTDQQAVPVAQSPASIWLSPICDETAHHGDGRTWASPAPDDACEDCGLPWVEYVRADLARLTPIEGVAASIGDDWCPDWKANGFNHAITQAQKALRYLADNDRPSGGEEFPNSACCYMIADELEITRKRYAALSTPPAISPAIPEGKSGDGVEAWTFNAETRDIECGNAPVFRVYSAEDFPCIEDEDRANEAEYFDAQAQTVVLMLNSLLHDSGDTTPVPNPDATQTREAELVAALERIAAGCDIVLENGENWPSPLGARHSQDIARAALNARGGA